MAIAPEPEGPVADRAADPAADAADEAGLRYVSDAAPGIRRLRRGRGFSYVRAAGTTVADRSERARIEAIAIPPAWTDVWICPHANGHILATGRDAKGRKQYRYHPRWREVRDADKYDRLVSFGGALPDMRAQVDRDMGRPGLPSQKVLAAVVKLLDETLIRVGNDEYAAANESFGLTTITADHVQVAGQTISFQFNAKGGIWQEVTLRDRRVARIVKRCEELPGHDLFAFLAEDGTPVDVTSSDVNGYLRQISGEDFTAKHFRTWGGTVVAAETLVHVGTPDDERAVEKGILAAIDAAAGSLGNTRAVCRNCYVHPRIPEAYRHGELHEVWRVARPTSRLGRGERAVLELLGPRG